MLEDLLVPPGSNLLRDPGDSRLASLQECNNIGILGVPWDWSITGRPGPRFAPQRIRGYLYSLNPHSPYYGDLSCRPKDFGDVKVAPGDWTVTRARIKSVVSRLAGEGSLILVGGDHSISYPSLSAVAEAGYINLVLLDHHYDLRSTSEGLTSGSWLYQVLKEHPGRVNALIIGVGDYSNPPYLQRRARELGVGIIPRSALLEGVEPALEAIDSLSGPVYLSIDMDHLDQAFAPGVNSPGVMGMTPWDTWRIISRASERLDVRVVDIVEVNPLVDVWDATSRLAAKLVAHIVNLLGGRGA